MNGGTATVRNPTLEVVLTLALIFGAAAALGYVYPAVQVLGFRNRFRELLFAVFSACSILWFLAPSHWAQRVSSRLRPQALRCAARGRNRAAAILLAAGDFSHFLVTAAQGFFAARLAVEALPPVASRLLPFIPFNASFMTSDRALKLMGPFLGPLASIAGWMLELMSILIRHRAWQLLLVLAAFPASRFCFRALEPAPRSERPRTVDRLRELLRTSLSSSCLFLGLWGALGLGGRSLSAARWLSILFLTTAISSQVLHDFLARAVIRMHRLKLDSKALKGFVGGCMVNGQFSRFNGLEAQISTSGGPVHLPAAVALKLARGKATAASECQVEVPVAAVMAGMEAAKKALNPVSKKAKLKKLVALPVAAILITVAVKCHVFGRVLYAFAVSSYLSVYVLPPPLVVVLPLIIFSFDGPIGSASSLGMALGLAASCLKQLLQKPPRGAQVACASLDVAQDKATIVWRGDASTAEEVGAKIKKAAADDKAKDSLKKHHKKIRIRGIIFSFVSLVLLSGVVMWRPFVFSVEDAVSKVGARLVIFGLCSGLSLRLLQYAVVPQAARFALPSPLGALSAGPGKTVHWFLAVNSRTAAAAAASAFLLPRVGLLQKIAYHLQLVHQVEWLDAWVFQISTAYLGCVLSVQTAKALIRWLSFRSPGSLLGFCLASLKATVLGCCSGLLTRCVLLATASPGPGLAGANGTSIATAVAVGMLAMPLILAQDWLARLSSRSGSYWARAAGELVPARLLNFEGHHAVLRPFDSDEAIAVPAAELRGAGRSELRPVRLHIPVESGRADEIEESVRFSLKQQVGLLQRTPLQPQVRVSQDRTSIQVTGFLERSAHPDQARDIRSSLLLAAANAAC